MKTSLTNLQYQFLQQRGQAAVDGIFNNTEIRMAFFASNPEPAPWFIVDLSQSYSIQLIRFMPRPENFNSERFKNYQVTACRRVPLCMKLLVDLIETSRMKKNHIVLIIEVQ